MDPAKPTILPEAPSPGGRHAIPPPCYSTTLPTSLFHSSRHVRTTIEQSIPSISDLSAKSLQLQYQRYCRVQFGAI